MLNKLAAVPDQKSDVVVHHVLTTLATNPYDVPLAMLYKFDESAEPTTLRLQGHSGLPEGHKLLVDVADIDSDQGLIPELRRAVCASEPIFIDHDDRFEAVPWRGWGAPSRKIAILPIRSPTRHFGYLVIGLNPYRPFDGPCCQFVNDLNRIVSTIVSAAITFELAETRREQLESDLAFSNLKLRHLVEHASVGMCHVSVDDGEILWANDRYFYLAGRSVVDHTTNHSFYDAYLDEDLPKVRGLCKELLTGVEHTNAELRVKRTYTSPNGEETPASIQILAFPYRDPESDQVKSIMACTTDISRLKWAQTFHARSAAQAREAKEQQEAFIDVVSHEMRNPLSAIVHCADAIIATAVGTKYAEGRGSHEALAEIVQNAKVVLQCSTHQRRILDDVLTLSKLKSMLLSIKPVSVDPLRMVSSIVGMFEAELNSNSIRCNVAPDPSLSDLAIDHVFLDTSRVTQIFINLLTNAIKFVKLSKEPTISITFGACKSYPRSFFPENMFWADGEPSSDVTKSSEWGLGEHVYLTFVVQDSGIGLSNNAIAKIFKRFSQAHVKTHVTYGGSGLGLYISKELAEKQGGEIGVTSVPGKGTKFGFYVKARRRATTRIRN
jgi:signal transduction histidine kinase